MKYIVICDKIRLFQVNGHSFKETVITTSSVMNNKK